MVLLGKVARGRGLVALVLLGDVKGGWVYLHVFARFARSSHC